MTISTFARLLFGVAMMVSAALARVEVIPSDRERGVMRLLSLESRKLGKAKNFGKFEKALKHQKGLKNSKSQKDVKFAKKSKKSKGDDDDNNDYIFSDQYWENRCFFNYFYNYGDMDDDHYGLRKLNEIESPFPNMDGVGLCIETFAENVYLDINIDKALDCSESIEKVAWKSYPSCFELRNYSPYVCEELYQGFDEAYECIYYSTQEPQCYFDDLPDVFNGCAVNFADSFELDAEQVLDCGIDLYEELDDKCYSNENSIDACEIFYQCESVLWSAEYCTYDTEIDLSNVATILEEELGVDDFLETLYDGTIVLEEVVAALVEYDDWTDTDLLEWFQFVECMVLEVIEFVDDSCYLKYYGDIYGECVERFADSFEDLNADDLLTCAIDIEQEIDEKCWDDESNMNTCEKLFQCVDSVGPMNYCAETSLGFGFSDLANILADSECSEILPNIYDGIVDLSDAFNELVSCPLEISGWKDFGECIDYTLSSDAFFYDDDDSMSR